MKLMAQSKTQMWNTHKVNQSDVGLLMDYVLLPYIQTERINGINVFIIKIKLDELSKVIFNLERSLK